MANKISTGTPIKLQDSSVGIIDFLVNYEDDNSTPCPQNYVNGKLLSGTGINNVKYIYSNDFSVISGFFGDKWYTVDQTWSNFCKNSFPVTTNYLATLSSSNKLANWEDFKNIVINSFIPLTNIRYCEFTKFTNSGNSTTYANIFLTDDSILSNHENFKDLFMNNTRQGGKKVITTIGEFIQDGEIGGELNTISTNAGPGKIIKSGWDGDSDESFNRLLLLCVKALNTIRTKLSCTFSDEMYNFKFAIKSNSDYTTPGQARSYTVSLTDLSCTLPAFTNSVLSVESLKTNVTLKSWYIHPKINNSYITKAVGESINFKNLYDSYQLLPSEITIRPVLNYQEISLTPVVKIIKCNKTITTNRSLNGNLNVINDIADFAALSSKYDSDGKPYKPYDLLVGLLIYDHFSRSSADTQRGSISSPDGKVVLTIESTNSHRCWNCNMSTGATWSDRMGTASGKSSSIHTFVCKPANLLFANTWDINAIDKAMRKASSAANSVSTPQTFNNSFANLSAATFRSGFNKGRERIPTEFGILDIWFPAANSSGYWEIQQIAVIDPENSYINKDVFL